LIKKVISLQWLAFAYDVQLPYDKLLSLYYVVILFVYMYIVTAV